MNDSCPSLCTVLIAAQEGKHKPWEQLCESIRDDLVQTARGLCKDDHLCEDLAQDALLAIRSAKQHFRPTPGHDPDLQASRYCRTIVRNKARDLLKKAGAKVQSRPDCAEQAAPDTSDAIIRKETTDLLRQGLHQVKAPYGHTLHQHYLEGRSRQEIAAEQGIAVKTVDTRLWRGLRRLRTILHKQGLAALTLFVPGLQGSERTQLPNLATTSKGPLLMHCFITSASLTAVLLISLQSTTNLATAAISQTRTQDNTSSEQAIDAQHLLISGTYFMKTGIQFKKRNKIQEAKDSHIASAMAYEQASTLLQDQGRSLGAALAAGTAWMMAERWDQCHSRLQSVITHKNTTPDIQAEALYWLGEASHRCHKQAPTAAGGFGSIEFCIQVFEDLSNKHPASKWAKFARGKLVGLYND